MAAAYLSHIFQPHTWVCVHWQLERLHNSPNKPHASFNTFRSANSQLPVLFFSTLKLFCLSTSVLSSAKIFLKTWRFSLSIFYRILCCLYKELKLCFRCMNIYCGVVISGQETGPECFVDPCHMTRETETERQRPSYKSERVNELLSSGALRPKTGLHGGQRLKQTHKHTHTQVLSLMFSCVRSCYGISKL